MSRNDDIQLSIAMSLCYKGIKLHERSLLGSIISAGLMNGNHLCPHNNYFQASPRT